MNDADGSTIKAIDLDRYGRILHSYSGLGALILSDNESYRCRFTVGQTNTGMVVLLCDFIDDLGITAWLQPARFQGVTNDGQEIALAPDDLFDLPWLADEPSVDPARGFAAWGSYHVKQLTVRSADDLAPTIYRFGVTNLLLDNAEWHLALSGYELTLPATTIPPRPSRVVTIRFLDRDRKRREAIAALRGTDVIAEIEIATLGEDFEFATSLVDDLCWLLSIARGTKIAWAYASACTDDNRLVFRQHRDAVSRPYTPFATADTKERADRADRAITKRFVESSWATYLEKAALYRLHDGPITMWLEARMEGDSLQVRGIKLVVLLELLKSSFMHQPNPKIGEFLLRGGPKLKLDKALRKAARDHFADPDGTGQVTQDVISNLGGVTRTPFKTILKGLLDELGIYPTADEWHFIIGARNTLVHEALFPSEIKPSDVWALAAPRTERAHEFFRLLGFLDRIMLRLVGYDGPYIDWSTYITVGTATRRQQVTSAEPAADHA